MTKAAEKSIDRIIKRVLKEERSHVGWLEDGRFVISDGMVLWAFPMGLVPTPYDTLALGRYSCGSFVEKDDPAPQWEQIIARAVPEYRLWPVTWDGLHVVVVDDQFVNRQEDVLLFWVNGEVAGVTRKFLREAEGLLSLAPYELRANSTVSPILVSWSVGDIGITGVIMPRKVQRDVAFADSPNLCPEAPKEGTNASS